MTLFKVGQSRDQAILLPARVEDYVGADNPVRVIDAYVGSLDLAALGFRHAARAGGAGQPPFDPADLLRLYLYGYTNQVRSSRRLEREAGRNLEVIWLLRGLVPGFRTVAAFRADNAAALRASCRDFVALLRGLDLVGGEVVAVDGAFFDGNASKGSIATPKRLRDQFAAAERDVAAYEAQLDAHDAAEAAAEECRGAGAGPGAGPDAAGRLRVLLARRARARAELGALEASGAAQLSRTDPDARLLSKRGQVVAGYNVQVAVDGKHKLIVASEVVSDGNDAGQLHAMARAAQAALGGAPGGGPGGGPGGAPGGASGGGPGGGALTVVADSGYYDGDELRACERDGVVAFVPEPDRGRRSTDGRLGLDAFAYDAAADAYACPHGQRLRPMPGRKRDGTGKLRIRYASRRSACRTCPLRARCLSPAGDRRVIERWEHEAVLDRHRARMAQEGPRGGAEMMRRRRAWAEHPFGTLKCRAGHRHFLVRGLAKVRGEWGLMALCYNLTRLLNILGPDKLLAVLARSGAPSGARSSARSSANRAATPLLAAWAALRRNFGRRRANQATTPATPGRNRRARTGPCSPALRPTLA